MSEVVISVEDVSKQYRLGLIGSGTLREDAIGWWYKVRGKEDPYAKIGETNDRTSHGKSDYVWALKDINFEVKQGEVLGIIGKNGAGKSTLLKLLSRVTAPTTGSIKVKGRIASLLEVGTGFHPELTGRENIYLNGAIMGMNRAEITSKLDEIIDFAGVERYIDTPVKRYSSGMYVRLAFAVAAHLEPEILIVDEVLAVGDAEFQKKALGKMKDVSSGEGRTVLFVSHNMASVKSLCSKAMLLKNGQRDSIGNVDAIVNNYLSINNRSDSTEVKTNLLTATRSEGIGKFISEGWIENMEGKPVNTLKIGEPFHIKFKFESPEPIKNALFGFGIEDSEGVRITSMNNEILGSAHYPTIRSGVACCTIENPNLMDGKYFISVSIVSNQFEWVDYIEQGLSFSIAPTDVYGTGRLITQGQGKIYFNGRISIL